MEAARLKFASDSKYLTIQKVGFKLQPRMGTVTKGTIG